jgi:hypothetical protein
VCSDYLANMRCIPTGADSPAGTCQPARALGEPCFGNGDCAGGALCTNGRCGTM